MPTWLNCGTGRGLAALIAPLGRQVPVGRAELVRAVVVHVVDVERA